MKYRTAVIAAALEDTYFDPPLALSYVAPPDVACDDDDDGGGITVTTDVI